MANQVSNWQSGSDQNVQPQPEIQVELRASLPGGRAFACVEQEGRLVWLASKEHVSEQAGDELLNLFQRVVQDDLVQKWPGAN
jgi:hypothetical protein